ncbi:MAG: DUF6691 family protein [Deltaproteobacteria bacterium]
MKSVIEALLLGGAFGWMLHRGGLTHYARIVNVYRFKDMSVMKFMLSAIASAAVILETARVLGLVETIPVPGTQVARNLVGGVVFGVGMAFAGYCPGTIVAEAGEGRLDAMGPGLIGLFTGALAFGLAQPTLVPLLARCGVASHSTFSALMGVQPMLLAVIFAEVVLIASVWIERRRVRTPAGDQVPR